MDLHPPYHGVSPLTFISNAHEKIDLSNLYAPHSTGNQVPRLLEPTCCLSAHCGTKASDAVRRSRQAKRTLMQAPITKRDRRCFRLEAIRPRRTPTLQILFASEYAGMPRQSSCTSYRALPMRKACKHSKKLVRTQNRSRSPHQIDDNPLKHTLINSPPNLALPFACLKANERTGASTISDRHLSQRGRSMLDAAGEVAGPFAQTPRSPRYP
jgi:hypothetical protein